jgi:hypothetical protein
MEQGGGGGGMLSKAGKALVGVALPIAAGVAMQTIANRSAQKAAQSNPMAAMMQRQMQMGGMGMPGMGMGMPGMGMGMPGMGGMGGLPALPGMSSSNGQMLLNGLNSLLGR